MPIFRVVGSYTMYCEKFVEADSEDDVYALFDSGQESFSKSDCINDDYDIVEVENSDWDI